MLVLSFVVGWGRPPVPALGRESFETMAFARSWQRQRDVIHAVRGTSESAAAAAMPV